jgi:hypothetical protein
MRLLDDERGQSVQVGAAILLGFVVIAITMYQVQVVADQNAEVEFNHQQEVRQDMIDLRNSIANAGTTGEGEATSVKLGVRYPPRTIFINPAPARGIFESEEAGNVSLSNAQVDGGPYTGNGNPSTLVSSTHRTNRLIYNSDYSEFGGVGNLTVEHSLAFASFENGVSDPMTSQPVVSGDTLTLTMLRGNLSEQGVDAISVDPRTVSRTTDPITISRNNTANPIVLTLPTRTPAVWNETIGTTYASGEPQARVDSWDSAAGEIQVSLNRSEYQLRMAAVGIGTGVRETDRYDVSRELSGGGGGGSYSLDWSDPENIGSNSGLSDCGPSSCTWDVGASDDTLDLEAALTPAFEDVAINFSIDNSTVGSISPQNDMTDGSGTVATTLTADNNGTINVLGTTDGAGDVIEIEVTNVSDSSVTGPSIDTRLDDLTQQDVDDPIYIASYDVSNTDSSFDRVDVTFDSSGGETLTLSSNNIRSGLRYEGGYGAGDSYTITFEVIYTDGNGNEYVAAQDSITDTADAVNPASNQDLSLAGSAQLTSYTIDDRTNRRNPNNPNDGQPRYRFSYTVSGSGSFSEVHLHALNLPGSSPSGEIRSTSRNENDRDINPSNGEGDEYRIGIIVRDANGVVVDVISVTDTADDSGTYTGP